MALGLLGQKIGSLAKCPQLVREATLRIRCPIRIKSLHRAISTGQHLLAESIAVIVGQPAGQQGERNRPAQQQRQVRLDRHRHQPHIAGMIGN